MKRLIQLFFIGSFLFVLPFVLFLGVFSTQGGDSTEFQPATPQEKVALDVSNFITGKGGTLEFA
ncbi:CHAP domain-containing protein, partial [Enterococcus faecalis]|nr:CHAP domain-containing protein [Enterococcus faecalis]